MLSKSFTTNYDLVKYAEKLNISLVAIIYKDELKQINPPKYGSYILNLDEVGQGGSHWTALFIPQDGELSYYFDSYGVIYPEAVKEYSKKLGKKNIVYNTKQIQAMRSGFCGQFSLTFLQFMQKKKGSYENRFNKFLNKFKEYNNNNI